MNSDLENIKDQWESALAAEDSVQQDVVRGLADAFVTAHPEIYTSDITGMTLDQLVNAVDVFRAAEMEDQQWQIEVWLIHHFEPQNIGGIAQPTVRAGN